MIIYEDISLNFIFEKIRSDNVEGDQKKNPKMK